MDAHDQLLDPLGDGCRAFRCDVRCSMVMNDLLRPIREDGRGAGIEEIGHRFAAKARAGLRAGALPS
ncbi:Hypothetical protein A7982_08355 [Minicystis rosea]|nr:Hypothetical protein A7982_08355 [Minicystis rosea]